MTDLRELEKRLEEATVGSDEIDKMIAGRFIIDWLDEAQFPGYGFVKREAQFSRSLDAAVALVERVLPGWSIELRTEDHHENGWRAAMWCSWGPVAYGRCDAREKALPTLALCLALVRALIAKGDRHE